MKKILIANRGEIAIRIARTAAAMGIKTVAIHSPDDALSLHVKHADEVRKLSKPGVSGYLDIEEIVAIAAETGCDAVHPGYGLLSERADFARACAVRGITFVGPDEGMLASQGDKVSARTLAKRAGVPVIEGSEPLTSAEEARAFFETQGGKPLMLKAVNGGGGRGMRVVHAADEIESAFRQCQAEALAAFGEDAVYAERFLPSVRHIEVQMIGDGQNVTHLWERDCSAQRRNQKIIELAPAPNLDPETRAGLLDAAVAIGKACDYRGLGTVEFLVEAGTTGRAGFYFIETNPRIQVEHTITEEITGRDLVEIQLRIAGGETLADIGLEVANPAPPLGFCVQTRVNTETFKENGDVVPTGGVLTAFEAPSGPGVRVDTYGYAGYRTNPNFDSLLAKVIVHEKSGDLTRLFARTERALSELHVGGVETNARFLRRLLRLPELSEWRVDVRAIDAKIRELASSADHGSRNRYFDRFEEQGSPSAAAHIDVPDGAEVVRAPMQAVLYGVSVAAGDEVSKDQELAVIEAMKMQHVLTAPCAGTVIDIYAEAGAVVGGGDPIIAVEPNADAGAETEASTAVDLDRVRPDLRRLRDRIELTLDEKRPRAVARRRDRGQRTTREHVAALCEGGDFHEYGQLVIAGQRRKLGHEALLEVSPADGIVTGVGSVNAEQFTEERNQVAILAYDSTVMAGTQGIFGHKKTDRMIEVAHDLGLPTIFFTEGGGGRPNDVDFADTMHSALDIKTFSEFARLKGWGPRITVNSGYCFAGNAALFGTGDIRIATRNSWIGLAGPAMIEAGGLGSYSAKEIGPAPMHAQTGLLDILAEDDEDAARLARQVLSYFQGAVADWDAADQRHLRHIVPENRMRAYPVRSVIETLADTGSFLELGAKHAPGLVTGFLRVEGRPLGLIANNPHHLGGALDAPASAKGARFLKLCARFGMPVLSLCDTPGFMVGPENERQGGVAAASDLIGAGAHLGSPLFLVVLRKGYGIGAQAMAGGSFANPVFATAWPTGEFGAMGLEGSVRLGFAKELEAEKDPEARQRLYDKLVASAYAEGGALNVASYQEIDAVIDPFDTRKWLVKGLRMSAAKKPF
nr:carboxyl transferase domain-containing protein [Defluviimonas salinarum]